MEKKEKERFSMELQLLKKYLLPEYYKEGKSAQEIFIEEYSNNILNNKKSLNREEIEKEANIKWNEMNEKEKAEWNELQKENDEFLICGNYRAKLIDNDGKSHRTKEPAIIFFYKKHWFNVIAQFKEFCLFYYCNIASPYLIDDNVIKYIENNSTYRRPSY